ncbi:SNARE-interacting protein KEULE [Linum perenne]
MSFSDSDSSSYGADYKNFKQITRERLLVEMLRSAKSGDSKSTWKVLIMDKLTVKIMSYACKMADITQEGVSCKNQNARSKSKYSATKCIIKWWRTYTKEDSHCPPWMPYTSSNQLKRSIVSSCHFLFCSIIMFKSDMGGKKPLYKKAFVFFSSPVSRDLVALVREGIMVSRIGALREMNLEYFAMDSQAFLTDHERALEELFGDDEDSRKGDAALSVIATRIATVFASLREFPYLRYRAAKSLDVTTMTTTRDLITTKLAARVWDRISHYKQKIDQFPQSETCDLLILDRSVDQIAPIIHEWTYDAICHDLLNMEGNKYVHEVPGKSGGPPEKKEVLLEEHDPLWVELRHAHIADASERLHDKMTTFVAKNKAAQIQHGSRDGELSTRDLQKMVQALPQYSEQIDKLSLHVEIAGKVNRVIRDSGLRDLGQLEQDLVFGDAGTKEVIKYLTTNEYLVQDASRENKLRLLMILASIYPEKFEGDKGLNLMKLAKLPEDDMTAVNNMRMFGGTTETKKSSASFSLKFDIKQKKRAARKDRTDQEETGWQLSRFYPMVEELVIKLNKGELSKDEYPCLNDPSVTFDGTSPASIMNTSSAPHSMRSRRTPTWAKPRHSDDGYSSDSVLRHASSDFKKMGRRIFVFIVGGATRSELRACHKLTTKLQREVVLGSTSLDDPPQFITKLKLLTANELSLDDLDI